MKQQTVKVTVNLPSESIEDLSNIAGTLTNKNQTMAIRKALKLTRFLMSEMNSGKKIIIHDESSNTSNEIIVL